jgi:hypothetical protein
LFLYDTYKNLDKMVEPVRKKCIIIFVERINKKLTNEDTTMTQAQTQNEDQQLRQEIQQAIAGVAAHHEVTLSINDVQIERDENSTHVSIDAISVHGDASNINPTQIEDIIEKYVQAHREVMSHHSAKRHRHRMIIAVSISAGIMVTYYVLHREFILHGMEWLIPAIIDKAIFGQGE